MKKKEPTYAELLNEIEHLRSRIKILENREDIHRNSTKKVKGKDSADPSDNIKQSAVNRYSKNHYNRIVEENEKILSLLLEYSPVYIYLKDEKTRALMLSKNYEKLIGKSVEELTGKTNDEIFPEDFAAQLTEDDLKILKGNKVVEKEEFFNNKYYTTVKFPIQIEGRPRYLAGFSMDITESKKALQELDESEARWKFALESARDGIWDWDIKHDVLFYKAPWQDQLGFKEDEIPNAVDEMRKLIPDDDWDECQADIQKHIQGELPFYTNIHRVRCIDGSYKWILDRGKVIRSDKDGKPLRMIGTHTDITEQKELEQALKESEARLKAIIHALPDMFIITDSKGSYLDFHIPDDMDRNTLPVISKNGNITRDFPNGLADKFSTIIKKAIKTGKMQRNEFSFPLSDGMHYYETRTIQYEKDKVLTIVRDITDYHQYEQTIKDKNKELKKLNDDKDSFISILAHDLKSPFSTILGFLDLLCSNVRTSSIEEIEEELKYVHNAVHKVYLLLEDLLNWTKSQAGKLAYNPEKVILKEVIDDTLTFLHSKARKKGITIESIDCEECALIVDPDMIKTVIRNLLSNAIKFTFEDGRIRISAEKRDNDVVITISDNGIGITKENIPKLWDMTESFSQRGTAGEEGTGLGLLLCKELIEKNGGTIWVESEKGKGSDFKFTLPITSNQ